MSEELKPCPSSCPGPVCFETASRECWRCVCVCGWKSPWCRSQDAARAEWNKRADYDRLAAIRAVVDEQAEDEGLWSGPLNGLIPIAEAYLRQELRRLHAVIEGEA